MTTRLFLVMANGQIQQIQSGDNFGAIPLAEISTPGTPAAGTALVYPKSDHKFYILDSTGAEKTVGSSAPTFAFFSG